MEYKCFVLGMLDTNCYVVYSDGEAGIIDPGGDTEAVFDFIQQNNLTVKWLLNTHGHVDHIISDDKVLAKYNVPLMIHTLDAPMLASAELNLAVDFGLDTVAPPATVMLNNEDQVPLGKEVFQVIHTPGHTPGGITLYTPGLAFSGDTLFFESIGRTDFPGGDYHQILQSIKQKLFALPDDTLVLPGHGGSTKIGMEKSYNPYVSR